MTVDSNTVSIALATVGVIATMVYAVLPVLLWRRQLTQDTLHTTATVADKVVSRIEQAHMGATGKTKKALALAEVRNILAGVGLNPPEPFIHATIEAAVLALRAGTGQSPPPPVGAGVSFSTFAYDPEGRIQSVSWVSLDPVDEALSCHYQWD